MTEKKQYPDWVETPLGIFVVVEFIALLIALALPVTPSKTGSNMDIASLFIEDPGYLENVLVAFVVTNLLIGAIALVAIVYIHFRKDDSRDAPTSP